MDISGTPLMHEVAYYHRQIQADSSVLQDGSSHLQYRHVRWASQSSPWNERFQNPCAESVLATDSLSCWLNQRTPTRLQTRCSKQCMLTTEVSCSLFRSNQLESSQSVLCSGFIVASRPKWTGNAFPQFALKVVRSLMSPPNGCIVTAS